MASVSKSDILNQLKIMSAMMATKDEVQQMRCLLTKGSESSKKEGDE